MSKAVIYYENWVFKKEGVNKWMTYWACIRGNWLQFYERQSDHERPELRKTLELTKNTKCALVKRNKQRLPFSIDNGVGVYYLKCDTELERYHWIFSILSAATGKVKRDLPKDVPQSMKEQEAFRKSTKVEKQEEKIRNAPPEKPPKEKTNAADITNKRRRKFAVRQENKMKRKEATRMKKLGLEPPPSATGENDTDAHPTVKFETRIEKLQCKRYISNMQYLNTTNKKTSLYKNSDPTEQTKHQVRQRPQTAGSTTLSSKNRTDDERNASRQQQQRSQKQRPFSAKQPAPNNQSTNEYIVTALVHPPSLSQIESFDNRGFANDGDIRDLPTIPVILADDDDSVLPNMVFTELSDSDTASTEEISLNSQNSMFLSLSSDDLRTAAGGGKAVNTGLATHGSVSNNVRRNSAHVKTSHTIISDDGNFQQVDFTGRVISSPDFSKQRRSRPQSAGGNLLTTNSLSTGNLLEQPISPIPARPLSPYKMNNVPHNRRKSQGEAQLKVLTTSSNA